MERQALGRHGVFQRRTLLGERGVKQSRDGEQGLLAEAHSRFHVTYSGLKEGMQSREAKINK